MTDPERRRKPRHASPAVGASGVLHGVGVGVCDRPSVDRRAWQVRRFALVVMLTAALPVLAVRATEPAVAPDAPDGVPSADALLDGVLQRLPSDPLIVTGELLVRQRHGVVSQELRFEIRLRLGDSTPSAAYTIRDLFGRDLERLTVVRKGAAAPVMDYAAGHPLAPAPAPALLAPVQNTDLTWMDLTLSFLWWRGGRVTGQDVVRGRSCYVVEVPAPAVAGARGQVAARCTKARLWIDREAGLLLQAESVGGDGAVSRRLWIKSVRKVNERWMIKEMEVQSFPAEHRTRMTILDVQDG